jgi:hypothetical protein
MEGKPMEQSRTVIVALTTSEALDVRMALNSAAMAWGDRAKLAREMGNAQEAQSCERIRRQHGELWDRIDTAQRALEAPCCQFHATGGERDLSCGGDAPVVKVRSSIARDIRAQNGLVD